MVTKDCFWIDPENPVFLIELVSHISTKDVCAVELRVSGGSTSVYQDSFEKLLTAASKKNPLDRPDPELAMLIAIKRALQKALKILDRQVEGRLKVQDAMHQVNIHYEKKALATPAENKQSAKR